MSETKTIEVDMVSDIVCPWCWIGLRNLMWAMHSLPEHKFTLIFRPFFLDGVLPEEGVDYHSYMDAKFPDREQRKIGINRLTEAGHKLGIDFRFDQIKRRPNTANAHRLILWAQGQNKGLQAKEALFLNFFTLGNDVGNLEVLGDIARQIGMDADLVRELLSSDQDKKTIETEVKAFTEMGISGVPTFIVDRKRGISGALPADDLARFLLQDKSE